MVKNMVQINVTIEEWQLEKIDKKASKEFDGNRSMALRHYLKKGLELDASPLSIDI